MKHTTQTVLRKSAPALAIIVVVGFLISLISAQEEEITVGSGVPSSTWEAFVTLCATIAPYCGVLCFLAPIPTIGQVKRDKTTGALPLLPYSSMVANASLWVIYGLMKNIPAVWVSNAIGIVLGSIYFATFVQYCSPMAMNLPGTADQHLKGTGAIILFNLCLAGSGIENASEYIGKEGVVICIVLFASPLAALKHVIASKSAASIPLPFTLACLVNCAAWSVLGLYKEHDFNIYFPNLMGFAAAVAQLLLKGIYGNRAASKDGLPK